MPKIGWLEAEIQAAIEAYFNLLDIQRRGEPVNKSELYRSLSSKFPNRTVKAFELKFQNIVGM